MNAVSFPWYDLPETAAPTPRIGMPQVDADQYANLIGHLLARGTRLHATMVAPNATRVHQEPDAFDVARAPGDALTRPVLIAADRFVIDGNHRRASHLAAGSDAMPVIIIGLPFREAIAELFSYPETYATGALN